ncbi:hypothetical protein C1X59_27590 [Pseudomonas sp. FW215-R2]|uniref:hypothetical protein n=1 Tax=unclassified Pseudomonas TaxID=196821 RepID=UPI000C87EFC9|nr:MULTISPECIES: hypothetical protein [unclassified Pseudomonas]PMW94847.1 hypothetical protein C1X59_27590 [Pseudomonas sp. FW215-R2]PMX05478.1 hypothetical protein C1X60_27875 [Pseudomonas sp. FW215-L1]PMX18032.1 hypothetical protein C1X57_27295 [Pseudomonas sp. FW215-E1]PNA31069.1 hypothetical protein C1X58_09350 [Pseudomonas sp. FW215-R4]
MSADLQSACERFDKALSSLLDMNAVLREDLEVLLAAFPDQSGQVLRRSFVRASWAYVEAITFAFKNMATLLVDEGACEMDPKDKEFLNSQRFEAVENVKATMKLAAKAFSVPERNLGGGADWRHVKPSNSVRNRLLHPKSVEDLQVSNAEWESHKSAFDWFVRAFDGLLTDIVANANSRDTGGSP